MIPINPITVDNIADPEMNSERMVQNVLVTFLRFYFSGNAFQTRQADGSLISMTFPACEVGAEETVLPDPLLTPYIHYYHLAIKEETYGLATHTLVVSDHRIMLDVTVPVSLPSSMAGVVPKHHLRRIADHCKWLFQSNELLSLAEKGLMRVRVVKPPSLALAPDTMLRRNMIIDFQAHYRIDRPRDF